MAPGAAVRRRLDGPARHLRDAADVPRTAHRVLGHDRSARLGAVVLPPAVRGTVAGVGHDRGPLGPLADTPSGTRPVRRRDRGMCHRPVLPVVPGGPRRARVDERVHHAAAAGSADRVCGRIWRRPDRRSLCGRSGARPADGADSGRPERRCELAAGVPGDCRRGRRHCRADAEPRRRGRRRCRAGSDVGRTSPFAHPVAPTDAAARGYGAVERPRSRRSAGSSLA